jgi:dihydroflavonol-4-reductase
MLLVTGGTGFVGSHLLDELASRGIAARALVRRPLPERLQGTSVEAFFGDLKTGSGLSEALRGVSGVIHLAGCTKALRRSDYYDGNVLSTKNLVEAAKRFGLRFVHVSSLAAAGPGSGVREDDQPNPVSEYGRSKLQGEQGVRAAIPGAVIIRPPVVYGPRDTDVFQIFKSVAQGVSAEIAGGDRWLSWIYVKDLVLGLIASLESPAAAGRTYYLAHRKPATWGDLTGIAARAMGRPAPCVIRVPIGVARAVGACAELWSRCTGRPGIISRDKILEARFPAWTCDPSRAARDLGFEAPTSLEEGVTSTLAWYREAGWLKF